MNLSNKFFYLMAGLVAVLSFASSVGIVLQHRDNSPKAAGIVVNLVARTNAWWVMVGLLMLTFLAGHTATVVLFGLMSFFALREFITLTPTRPGDHHALSVAFFILVPLQYYLVWSNWYALFAIFLPVYAFLLLPSITVLAQDTEQFLERAAKIQWGLMIAVYCISHAPALLMLEIPGYAGQNVLLLLYLIVIAQFSDVLQYAFGTLLGKTKVAPLVSPNKTVEGLAGGAVCATAVGAALWWMTPFSPLQSAGMAFAIVIMGFLGGLVMSAIKRSMGAKDWGTMIKGHGGMLDRLDSVCFAAPIFFHLTRYFFT